MFHRFLEYEVVTVSGGKYGLSDVIAKTLPKSDCLIEPFVGAGSIFLNTNYRKYILNDINQDLINLYKILQSKPDAYIRDAQSLFTAQNNHSDYYYQLRKEFNDSADAYFRSLVFLYMNRHGYNGLCRYNKSGGYNVPFGKYKRPYFPEAELNIFADKAQQATFVCEGYRNTINRAKANDVIYCDPPYVPLSKSASFTSYAGNSFGLDEQADLANAAEEVSADRAAVVLISNHDTIWTRKIYEHASKITSIKVARTISAKADKREKVTELMALYRK